MEITWFILVALMIVAYAVLDGFDLGAGILHMLVSRNDADRRAILRSIGPVWDGNEVWLIAGGGTLYFAFPALYAVSFSGFYLPLHIVLWLLILRGMGIEFRAHLSREVAAGLFDGFFALSSGLLALFFGAALGNVIRGVPMGADQSFFEPLWTTLLPWGDTGILDWYTIFTGVFTVIALTMHGALWISLKTDGAIRDRASMVANRTASILGIFTIVGVPLTILARPATVANYLRHPVLFVIPAAVIVSLYLAWLWNRRGRELPAFLASCAYIVTALAGVAAALYPALLPSSYGSQFNITIFNAATGSYALRVGFIWWGLGMVLATGYFIFVYRMFRGKLQQDSIG
ncbi:MAG TPA: cytochrome d ubiquinol oxidase subunit II [Verrucomicrobiae bacterium]|nr:cytochrome d ubiquinol oxidase subunit II [Verrucomicrobiae bacterium]